MKITVCIGSSCHIKGSAKVVEILSALIERYSLSDKVELAGAFCMGRCKEGVCAAIDDDIYSLTAENTEKFFLKEVLERVKK